MDWFSYDNLDRYQKNYNDLKKREILEKNNWGYLSTNNIISYNFNSHGFRCKEFTTTDSVVFLGASDTLAIGIPEYATFANIIANKLHLECYNLGTAGGSSDSCFRIARYWISYIKPKMVIFIAPPKERYEIKIRNQFEKMIFSENNECFNTWVIEEDNCILNQEKNHFAIAYICNQLDIKFVYYDDLSIYINKKSKLKPIDLARDLMHHGILSQLSIAEQILSKI
jgi:hypothetical protein